MSQKQFLLGCIAVCFLLAFFQAHGAAPIRVHSFAVVSSHPKNQVNQAYTLPPDLLRKARTLSRLRAVLSFGGTAGTIIVLLVMLALRWPVLLRDWAENRTRRWWLQGILFTFPSILFLMLLSLPLSIYSHHVALQYGFSVQSWNSWFGDQAKAALLSIIVFTPLTLLLFEIMRWSPRRWWLWFWLCTLPIIIFGVFISPVWIDPIFNHFSPLQSSDPQLVLQLEKLAQHAGLNIPPQRMFLMRASEKVTGLNAYVTGIGSSKRIVVWDTTAHNLPMNQVLFIAGHEMGHYVLDHIYKGLAFSMLLLLALFWLGAHSVRWMIRRYRSQWGIRSEDDWAALAILLLVFTSLSFLSSPIVNSFSRWEEHQADIFGQEAIHGLVTNPQRTAQGAFDALGRTYLEVPHPNRLLAFWLFSHPSISQRAEFAAHYDPWVPGKKPKYFPR